MPKVELMNQDPVDEDGLTAQEREYLDAPFSQLDENQRRIAMAIKDKLTANRYASNDLHRREQEAKRPKFK